MSLLGSNSRYLPGWEVPPLLHTAEQPQPSLPCGLSRILQWQLNQANMCMHTYPYTYLTPPVGKPTHSRGFPLRGLGVRTEFAPLQNQNGPWCNEKPVALSSLVRHHNFPQPICRGMGAGMKAIVLITILHYLSLCKSSTSLFHSL